MILVFGLQSSRNSKNTSSLGLFLDLYHLFHLPSSMVLRAMVDSLN